MNNFTRTFIVNDAVVIDLDGKDKEYVKIGAKGEYGKFLKEGINKIWKRVGSVGTDGQVVITNIGDANDAAVAKRFSFDLKKVGENVSEFSNALTRNAKSYCVDVDTAATIEDIVKAVKAQQALAGEYLFTISHDGTADTEAATITIKADAYTDIVNVKLSSILVEEKYTAYSTEVEKAIDCDIEPIKCVNPFGTAKDLIKNYSLPTLANTGWLSLNEKERPVVGAEYNQYTIEYAVERNDVHGQGAVGQSLTSVTTHVFFVNKAVDGVDGFGATLGAKSGKTPDENIN